MLAEKLREKTIILASGSPRRQQLLKDLGVDFVTRVREINETFPPELTGVHIPEHVALQKILAFKDDIEPNQIVLTGDTIVWHEGKALGKPQSQMQAYSMLRSLSGKEHTVISSICGMNTEEVVTASDMATVHVRDLSEEEMIYYVKNGNPMDKAGAYGIQEWLGHVAVTKIEGSFNTVMGFPTHLVYKMLMELAAV
ncbi:Maf family nucleotide pyrophosphatase [Croceiramulus getboli]|nr:Maf family nucleotide pyrophosphatase [Flavobacteriaceae bacterium YJPT1-3]